jgi:hypothetical protein
MLSLDLSVNQHTPLVGVRATNNRGFTPEELASQCAQKIVSVADTAPPAIRDQAIAYQKSVEKLVAQYFKQVVLSDRTTVYNALNDAGHPDLADLIRRI